MPLMMESEVEEVDVPEEENADSFFEDVARASRSALLLDFDGTLAPFRLDPVKVKPWAGVTKLLEAIQANGRTRLAIITGRPAEQVSVQLGMSSPIEIWGLHGSERLMLNGELELEDLSPDQLQGLAQAREAIRKAALHLRVEDKWNAVVVHWRGKTAQAAEKARRRTGDLLDEFEKVPGMSVLRFDGGIELRAGRNKGDAVRLLLEGVADEVPVAYLGDDRTDEDAFRALSGRGLGVLVRREWRPGAARLWLKPPGELRKFLASWLMAVQR
jgi:trehalose 6-phosphate phosphatase